MIFRILVFSLFLLIFIQNSHTIYAISLEFDDKNFSKSIEQFRLSSDSKIHPILIQWKLSDNPNEFAKKNNLSNIENKIGVYIYLDAVESKSKIPQDIIITAFDEKIIVAFVSSEQLDKLVELDFVERITPPDFARNPPIPQIEISETPTQENPYYHLIWIVIGIITIIIITKFKKRKSQKN
jgi:hypothetical protein